MLAATEKHPAFLETGNRMLHAWNDGMNSLRLQKTWSPPSQDKAIAAARFSNPQPIKAAKAEKVGRSPLLGKR